MDEINIEKYETATFAMGWFWGPDARFGITEGVMRTRVGYCGGTKRNPTYKDLGDHTETIQIDYNPSKISYKELIEIFWENHSPEYEINMKQYMSIVFYHNENQKRIAIESKKRQEEKANSKIYTEIRPIEEFYLAEGYHQKHYLRLVRELMEEFERMTANINSFIDSTTAARVNGYIKGYGTIEQLKKDIKDFRLSDKGEKRLFQIVEGYGG